MTSAIKPGPRAHRWRRRIAFLAGLLVVGLLLLEIGLRVVGLGNPVLYVSDPACGYFPAPNQDVHRLFKENYINSFGMRSPQVSARKPSGVYRALFVGDSVTYGTTYVDQKDIFTSILQRDLPSLLHKTVEVLNASAGGWASSNEAAFVRSRGTYDADLVVFVLNTGDLNQPFNGGELNLAIGYPDHKPPLAIWELWARYVKPRLTHHSTADAGSVADTAPADTMESAGVLHALESTLSLCQARGSRFAIVYVPSHGTDWDTPAYQAWLEKLRHWAAEQDVPLLNCGNALATAPQATAYRDGVHLRAEGDALVAHAIEQNWDKLASGQMPSATQPVQ